jgi:hypothetical protein
MPKVHTIEIRTNTQNIQEARAVIVDPQVEAAVAYRAKTLSSTPALLMDAMASPREKPNHKSKNSGAAVFMVLLCEPVICILPLPFFLFGGLEAWAAPQTFPRKPFL